MNKNILYVLTILEAIEKIKIYTKEYQSADEFFMANVQKDFNAVLNLLIAIGEDAKKIEESLKQLHQEIDWDSIVGLRNELSHNYRGIDSDIVWDIVCNYLDSLKEVCIKLLREIDLDKSSIKKFLSTKYYQNIQYLKEIL